MVDTCRFRCISVLFLIVSIRLWILQEKLSALHVRNQQQMKESRKLALIGNAARYQLEAANNLY